MSVMHFPASELANVVAYLDNAHRYPGEREETRARRIERIVSALEIIARANAACYTYRYRGEPCEAVTHAEIKRALKALATFNAFQADSADALSVIGLLHYNCQEDRDFIEETPGGFQALSLILELALRAQREG